MNVQTERTHGHELKHGTRNEHDKTSKGRQRGNAISYYPTSTNGNKERNKERKYKSRRVIERERELIEGGMSAIFFFFFSRTTEKEETLVAYGCVVRREARAATNTKRRGRLIARAGQAQQNDEIPLLRLRELIHLHDDRILRMIHAGEIHYTLSLEVWWIFRARSK